MHATSRSLLENSPISGVPEVPFHLRRVDRSTTGSYVAAAASLFQTTNHGRASKPLTDVFRALAQGDVEHASKRLTVLESGAGVHRFRKKLESSYLPDDIVQATATLLARDADCDLDRQGRVELLLRRLLVVHGGAGEQIVSRENAAPILHAVCEGFTAPADVRASALASFHDANTKLHGCDSVEDVFSRWVIADVLGFKATLPGAFRDPDVLYAAVAFSVEVENRLEMLSALEEHTAAGEVSHRLWKLELELRAMFRQMKSSGERYQPGVFEKVDWRRFKWRQGLVRLRDAKVEARPTPWRRIRMGVAIAATALLIPAMVPAKSPLRAADIDLSTLSPMLTTAVTNGDAFAFRADAEKWAALDDDQRASEAGHIRAALEKAGVRDTVIQVHGAIAIRIEANVVVFVAMHSNEEKR